MSSPVVPQYPSLAHDPARLKLENYPIQFDLPLRKSDTTDGRCIGSVGIARYFEDVRMKFIKALADRSGLEFKDWVSVIRHCTIETLVDATYPHTVTVGCSILHIGNTSYRGGYGIFQGGACVALSDASLVWIDPDYRPLVPVEGVKATLAMEKLRS